MHFMLEDTNILYVVKNVMLPIYSGSIEFGQSHLDNVRIL